MFFFCIFILLFFSYIWYRLVTVLILCNMLTIESFLYWLVIGLRIVNSSFRIFLHNRTVSKGSSEIPLSPLIGAFIVYTYPSPVYNLKRLSQLEHRFYIICFNLRCWQMFQSKFKSITWQSIFILLLLPETESETL